MQLTTIKFNFSRIFSVIVVRRENISLTYTYKFHWFLYIIIALVNIKTSYYLSKTNEVWNKARGWIKIHYPYVTLDIVTFAIYSNNNGNMVVGETPEFFPFSKSDISTARCKCTIYIFTYKGIKVVIRTEFINMTVLLSM